MDEFNSPMNQTPPVDPMSGAGGLGMLMADPMAQQQQARERGRAFMMQIQQLQQTFLALAKSEPDFAEAAQQMIEISSAGMAKVIQAQQQNMEGIAPPY
jgi:hypothetical protein